MADDTGTGTPSAAPSSGASPAASASSAESASASTTATPATPGAPAAQDASAEPPKERWDSILANTRTKTRADVEAEFKQKYGWADRLHENPVEFYDWLHDQLASHPEHGPKILAKAGRALQARRGASSPQGSDEPQPDVPIVDGQGNQTGSTYSAKQLKAWQDWNWTQREQALNERFGPLEKLNQRIEQAEQTAQIQQQAETSTRSTLETLRQDPFFKDHETAIKAEFAAHEEYGDNIHAAYVRVLTRDVMPTLSQTGQRQLLDSLNQKAAAPTVNPGGTASTPPRKFKDFGDALRYYAEHPDEAAAMANR